MSLTKPTDNRFTAVREGYDHHAYPTPFNFGGVALGKATVLNMECLVVTRGGSATGRTTGICEMCELSVGHLRGQKSAPITVRRDSVVEATGHPRPRKGASHIDFSDRSAPPKAVRPGVGIRLPCVDSCQAIAVDFE